MNDGAKLWLWKNGDHYLAYLHEHPCYEPAGDPMTLGEPTGYAIFRTSHDRTRAPFQHVAGELRALLESPKEPKA